MAEQEDTQKGMFPNTLENISFLFHGKDILVKRDKDIIYRTNDINRKYKIIEDEVENKYTKFEFNVDFGSKDLKGLPVQYYDVKNSNVKVGIIKNIFSSLNEDDIVIPFFSVQPLNQTFIEEIPIFAISKIISNANQPSEDYPIFEEVAEYPNLENKTPQFITRGIQVATMKRNPVIELDYSDVEVPAGQSSSLTTLKKQMKIIINIQVYKYEIKEMNNLPSIIHIKELYTSFFRNLIKSNEEIDYVIEFKYKRADDINEKTKRPYDFMSYRWSQLFVYICNEIILKINNYGSIFQVALIDERVKEQNVATFIQNKKLKYSVKDSLHDQIARNEIEKAKAFEHIALNSNNYANSSDIGMYFFIFYLLFEGNLENSVTASFQFSHVPDHLLIAKYNPNDRILILSRNQSPDLSDQIVLYDVSTENFSTMIGYILDTTTIYKDRFNISIQQKTLKTPETLEAPTDLVYTIRKKRDKSITEKLVNSNIYNESRLVEYNYPDLILNNNDFALFRFYYHLKSKGFDYIVRQIEQHKITEQDLYSLFMGRNTLEIMYYVHGVNATRRFEKIFPVAMQKMFSMQNQNGLKSFYGKQNDPTVRAANYNSKNIVVFTLLKYLKGSQPDKDQLQGYVITEQFKQTIYDFFLNMGKYTNFQPIIDIFTITDTRIYLYQLNHYGFLISALIMMDMLPDLSNIQKVQKSLYDLVPSLTTRS